MPDIRAAAGHHALVQPWRHLHLESVDSTNSEAMRLAVDGQRGPLWIQADRQTQGRGRSGRQWYSATGNLAVSLLFTPRCEGACLPQLSLVAGIAVHDLLAGLEACNGDGSGGEGSGRWTNSKPAPIRLKWPNDILVGDAKLGGVLIESSRLGADLVTVIGIGLNLATAPEIAPYPVTSLQQHFIGAPTPRALAERLAPVMHRWLGDWAGGAGFNGIRAAWLERSLPPGCQIAVHADGAPVRGSFGGIGHDGALLLRLNDGAVRRFTFGDVAIVPADLQSG